jgi:hypothetical protein
VGLKVRKRDFGLFVAGHGIVRPGMTIPMMGDFDLCRPDGAALLVGDRDPRAEAALG